MAEREHDLIAIDGPSGSGKSTVARAVAERLGWRYLDTGAMYRAITLAVLDAEVDPSDAEAVVALAAGTHLEIDTDPAAPRVRSGGRDVTRRLRTPRVDHAVSVVSAVPAVRRLLVARQRELAAAGPLVVEGRDIGTVVFPEAALKVFLTARSDVRAGRRQREREADAAVAGAGADSDATARTQAELDRRDRLDSTRATSPLAAAADALVVETDTLGVDEVVEHILDTWRTRAGPGTGTGTGTGEPGSVAAPLSPRRVVQPDIEYRAGFYRVVRLLLGGLSRLIFRLRVSGQSHVPHSGAALLAGNHEGFLDGPLVALHTPRPAYFLAKSEIFRGPLARVLAWCGQIPVDRGRADRAALARAVRHLKAGQVVGMFPEGTRGTGRLAEIQHGIGWVALRTGAPIVPVACLGAERALPRGARVPRPGIRVDIVFGAPFRVDVAGDPRSRRAVATAAEQIRVRLAEHLHAAEAGRRT